MLELQQDFHFVKQIHFGILTFDPDRFLVAIGGKEVRLRRLEFKLLEHLVRNRGRLATREALLNDVWGYDAGVTTRTVDTHIKQLREKLGEARDYIETLHGWGYRFKDSP